MSLCRRPHTKMNISGAQAGTHADQDQPGSVKGENKDQGQGIMQKNKPDMSVRPPVEVKIRGDHKSSGSVWLLGSILTAVILDINIQSVSLLLLFLALLWVLDAWTTIRGFEEMHRIKYEAKINKYEAERVKYEAERNKLAETA